MSLKIFTCQGGDIALPDKKLVLVDRQSGGNLVVNPPREVWERSELNPDELTAWSFLVAAAGRAMLDVLPQLEGGCLNYWEAGNWALNEQAAPEGFKTAKEHRKVHLHLLGRNPGSTDHSWKWGEAPIFPLFVDRYKWAKKNERLTAAECQNIVERVEELLKEKYGMRADRISARINCESCGLPTPNGCSQPNNLCAECAISGNN